MAGIRLLGVTRSFGPVKAVDDFTLEIPNGSFATLLGPSGCGKTTTLRMIAGLDNPNGGGEIWIGDQCAFSEAKAILVHPAKRKLGLVFQSYALWPHLTVFENISFGLQIQKLAKQAILRKVEAIASMLHIGELLSRYPSELSGGQQQRVAIARVLVMEPEVLLLDEPLSNLDAKLRMDMRAELKRLHTETGSTIVYVTHDQMEALTLSTHVAVMHKGKLQQWAAPMEVYNRPANIFTADFIGNPRINLIEGILRTDSDGSAHLEKEGVAFPIPIPPLVQKQERVTLGLRAEDLEILPPQTPGTFPATVYSVLPTGAEWYIRVQVKDILLTITTYQDMGLQNDSKVGIRIKSDRIKLFDTEGNLII